MPASSGSSSITLAGDSLHPMTPNLGQGGCTALEDALVLARCLQQQQLPSLAAELRGTSSSSGSSRGRAAAVAAAAVQSAIGQYERERMQRCLPLTIRSYVMGALLQVRGVVRCDCTCLCLCWCYQRLCGACSTCTCLLLAMAATSPGPGTESRFCCAPPSQPLHPSARHRCRLSP
jgi:hypothetical protein